MQRGAGGCREVQGAGWADPLSRVNNASTGGLHIGPMVTLTGGGGRAFNLFPIKDKSDESPNSLISCLMASDICTGAADRRLNADQCDR